MFWKKKNNNNKSELPTWVKWINRWTVGAFIVIVMLAFFISKWYFYSNEGKENWFALTEKDIWDHMDFWGYFLGALGIAVGAIIAKLVEVGSHKKFKKLEEAEEQIMKATDDLMTNATIKSTNKFPELFKEIKQILSTENREDIHLYIMNKTSYFGRIHCYNPDITKQFIDDAPSEYNEDTFIKGIQKLQEDMVQVDNLLTKCFETDFKELKLVTYDKERLITDFINPYFETEDKDENSGLKYFKLEQGNIKIKTLEKKTKRDEILKVVCKEHEKVLEKLENARSEKGFNDACVTKFSNNDRPLPMQMYLVQYTNNNLLFYKCLVIFAVEKKTKNNQVAERLLVGISASSQQIFNVFKSLFDDIIHNRHNQN